MRALSVDDCCIVGELGLDGSVRPVAGLTLAGVDDAAGLRMGQPCYADEAAALGAPAPGVTLLLKHQPLVTEELLGRFTAQISGHTHGFWHDAPTAARPFHQIIGGGPQTKSTDWSPTPATVIKLEADEKTLSLEVVEAASRRSLLSLKLPS